MTNIGANFLFWPCFLVVLC